MQRTLEVHRTQLIVGSTMGQDLPTCPVGYSPVQAAMHIAQPGALLLAWQDANYHTFKERCT